MLGSDRVVAEQLDPFAVNDGANVGRAQLLDVLPGLLNFLQWKLLFLALLVLDEGVVERAGDDRLVHLRQVDEDVFLLLQLGRSY